MLDKINPHLLAHAMKGYQYQKFICDDTNPMDYVESMNIVFKSLDEDHYGIIKKSYTFLFSLMDVIGKTKVYKHDKGHEIYIAALTAKLWYDFNYCEMLKQTENQKYAKLVQTTSKMNLIKHLNKSNKIYDYMTELECCLKAKGCNGNIQFKNSICEYPILFSPISPNNLYTLVSMCGLYLSKRKFDEYKFTVQIGNKKYKCIKNYLGTFYWGNNKNYGLLLSEKFLFTKITNILETSKVIYI